MASVVLDNSQFSPVPQQNVLVADGLKLGGGGFSTTGAVTTGSILASPSVNVVNNLTNTTILRSTIFANSSGVGTQQLNAIGSTTTYDYFTNNAELVYFTAPQWSPTLDYRGANNNELVVYGVNTAPAGDYPNNIFFADDAAPSPPPVGTPPTNTPAPYPVLGPAVNPGWTLAATAAFFKGASVVDENGVMEVRVTAVQGNAPAITNYFGGGGESTGISVPRGVTIQEADTTTLQGNNGALLDVAGTCKADGFSIHNTDQNLSPASSANALFIPASPNGFVLGQNYVWTAPVAPATQWKWVGSAGLAGQTTINGPAQSMAFDINSIVLLTPVYTGATACGSLTLSGKSATEIIVDSRDPAGALVAGDVRSFQWIVFNPNWAS